MYLISLRDQGETVQTTVKLSLAQAAYDTGLSVSASWHTWPGVNRACQLMDHKGLLVAHSQLHIIQQCNTNPLVFCVSKHDIQTPHTVQAPCSKTKTKSTHKSSWLGNSHCKTVILFFKSLSHNHSKKKFGKLKAIILNCIALLHQHFPNHSAHKKQSIQVKIIPVLVTHHKM